MIPLEASTQQIQSEGSPQCFNIQKEVKKQVYALTIEVMNENAIVYAALSDYSLVFFDLNTMKMINHLPTAHTKRINDIKFIEKFLYSCSNDGSIKIWDGRTGKSHVAQFKTAPAKEIYSVSRSDNTLVGGIDSEILFWDTRTQKLTKKFSATHSDEVTSLNFHHENTNLLLSASLDGLVCLSDLSKEDEEEAVGTVLKLEQPINTCKFHKSIPGIAYAQTTVQTLGLLSLEESTVLKELNTIENLETNEFSLLGEYDLPGDPNVYYLRGNLEGHLEEYAISLKDYSSALISRFDTPHKGPITKAERISNKNIISAGEDCRIYVTEIQKPDNIFNFDNVKEALVPENENKAEENGHN